MRTRTLVLAAMIAAVVTAGLFGDDTRILGRDVAREGRLTGLSGSLEQRDNEWFVEAADGSYQLMMGRYGYQQPLPLEQGAAVEVRGFTVPDYVAPISVATGGDSADFWHEARYPLWAGSGERRNAVDAERGARAADARGLALDRRETAEPELERREQQHQLRGRDARESGRTREMQPEAAPRGGRPSRRS
ncbi:MAG: hypothetical protein EA384_14185 [Spirochaetaceae bacterium]|nr:MAG: hypothetical protein EA384_14185 [Spirochaetaceae bacterium]